jgi:hypothetical protein
MYLFVVLFENFGKASSVEYKIDVDTYVRSYLHIGEV